METYLITGANRGIGLELSRQLIKGKKNVIAVCRTLSSELKQLNPSLLISNIDISQEKAIFDLKKALSKVTIDVLINNAGIRKEEYLDNLNFNQIIEQFEVNALGALRVSHSLTENLIEGSKVIFITSRMGSISDNTSGAKYGYRMSKAALNMAAVSYAHDVKHKGICIGVLHPGLVSTDMTNQNGMPASEAAKNILTRIKNLNFENSGQFLHANGDSLPW